MSRTGKPRKKSVVVEQPPIDVATALIDLASPVFGWRPGEPVADEVLTDGIHLAMMAWNAGTPGAPRGTLKETYDMLDTKLGPVVAAMVRPFFDAMLASRRKQYGHDPRVVVSFEIVYVPYRGRRLDVMTGVLKKPPPS